MKITLRPTKVEFIILLTILILVLVFLLTDVIRIENSKEPIFCVSIGQYLDGGTKEYYGLGYKIIDYNILEGFNGYKVGTYFMKYDGSLN